MKVFKLSERARKRLQQNNTLYQEQVDIVLGILRSSGVLPYKRSSLNGHIHKLVATMIVDANDTDATTDVATGNSL